MTKYLINIFSILNRAKYSSLGIFQNHIVFMPLKNTLNILVDQLDRYLDWFVAIENNVRRKY